MPRVLAGFHPRAPEAHEQGMCAPSVLGDDLDVPQEGKDMSRAVSADSSAATSTALPGCSCDSTSASAGGSAGPAGGTAAPAATGAGDTEAPAPPPWAAPVPAEAAANAARRGRSPSAASLRGTAAFDRARRQAEDAAAAYDAALRVAASGAPPAPGAPTAPAGDAPALGGADVDGATSEAVVCPNCGFCRHLAGARHCAECGHRLGEPAQVQEVFEQAVPIVLQPEAVLLQPTTTVVISGLASESSPLAFRRKLDDWGLEGTYDLFYMPAEEAAYQGFLEGAWPTTDRLVIINFTSPSFAMLCSWIFQDLSEGVVSLAAVQGHEENVSYCGRLAGPDPPLGHAPMILQASVPCRWAAQASEAMMMNPQDPLLALAPGESKELKGQFKKTKFCIYFKKKRTCRLGEWCPFAHTKEELKELPNLEKTRLCFAFLRGKCDDRNCRYAHGRKELRATDYFYKTELCHWWEAGSCKAGANCRYAHGEQDLRVGGEPWESSAPGDFSAPDMGLWFSLGHGGGAACGSKAAVISEEPWPAQPEESPMPSTPSPRGMRRAVSLPRPWQGGGNEIGSSVSAGEDDAHAAGGLAFRSRNTFMEAVQPEAEPLEYEPLLKRSFSCGDLDQLAQALAELEEESLGEAAYDIAGD